jgi:hypothetical protein
MRESLLTRARRIAHLAAYYAFRHRVTLALVGLLGGAALGVAGIEWQGGALAGAACSWWGVASLSAAVLRRSEDTARSALDAATQRERVLLATVLRESCPRCARHFRNIEKTQRARRIASGV